MMNAQLLRQGSDMTAFRVLSSVLLLTALMLQPLNVSAAEEGKFRLVYLVSTEKVEVGANVYVEPLFLTDGKQIEFLYRYCRAATGVKGWSTKIGVAQLGEQAVIVKKYCSNEEQELRGDKFHVVNQQGHQLQLTSVRFNTNANDARFVVPPLLPKAGVATISAVSGSAVDYSSNTSADIKLLPAFFWMAADQKILQAIVPRQLPPSEKAKGLIESARVYAKEVQGTVYTWSFHDGQTVEEGKVRFHGPWRKFKPGAETGVELVVPMAIDLDLDGSPDVVFGMQHKRTADNDETTVRWVGTGFIFGNGRKSMYGISTKGYPEAWHPGLPYGILRINNCNYVATSIGDASTPYDLVPLPVETSNCRFGRAHKFLEAH